MAKKKLLILVDWFWPGYKAGGPIKSCLNICAALYERFDIYVLTTDTDHGETEPYPGIVSNQWLFSNELKVHIYYAKKSTFTIQQLSSQIKLCHADIVYLNHLFSPKFVVYPLWLAYTKKIAGKMVVCPRGALYDSALAVKKYKKMPLLFLYRQLSIHTLVRFHATNKREEAAIRKYFPGSEVVVADNLPSMKQAGFRSMEKKPGELSCIFIARLVPIKNLLFLLQVLKNIDQHIRLTIAGPVEDEAYWNTCLQLIATLPSTIKVSYVGAKPNDELEGLLQDHHLFVLPTMGENFGHSIFEAMLAGRPVLISDQTPWQKLEAVNAGWELPLADPGSFANAILYMVHCSQDVFDGLARGAWEHAQQFVNNKENIHQYEVLFS